MTRWILTLLGIVAAGLTAPSLGAAQLITLDAVADATVRSDLAARVDDNTGCDYFLVVGGSRGGAGPWGTPDAMRTLIRFDLSSVGFPIAQATLRLTISAFVNYGFSSETSLQVHRVTEPWLEGDGSEWPSGTSLPCPWVNDAIGVDWLSQPDQDPSPWGLATLSSSLASGTTVEIDVTGLVRLWQLGTVDNHGLALRDVSFVPDVWHQLGFISRNAVDYTNGSPVWPLVGSGPQLLVSGTVATEPTSWGRLKALY